MKTLDQLKKRVSEIENREMTTITDEAILDLIRELIQYLIDKEVTRLNDR